MNKRMITTIIFNIAETALILLSGLMLGVKLENIVLVMLVFMISRGFFGHPLHFKTWYRCLIWSLLILTSLFVILKINLVLCILFAVFGAFIMTGKSNIQDMYLWKNDGEPSKYQDIVEFIKYNEYDDKLLEFEKKLKEKSSVDYLIYKYRFIENKTFAEISEALDMDGPRIVERLDRIAFAIRLYCRI